MLGTELDTLPLVDFTGCKSVLKAIILDVFYLSNRQEIVAITMVLLEADSVCYLFVRLSTYCNDFFM